MCWFSSLKSQKEHSINCKKDVDVAMAKTEKSSKDPSLQESGYCRICNMIVVMRLADHFKTVKHMQNVKANLKNVEFLLKKAGKNHHHQNKVEENILKEKNLQNSINDDSWSVSKKAKLDDPNSKEFIENNKIQTDNPNQMDLELIEESEICSICKVIFKSQTEFQNHMLMDHMELECEICGKKYKLEDEMKIHLESHLSLIHI